MKIFKDTSKIIEEFRIRLQGLSEAIKNIGEKIERVQSVLNMVTGSVGSFMKRTGKKKNDRSSEDEAGSFAEVAKDAVDRAVEATADRMRKITKKIRK
jgi:phage-related protein